MNKNKADAANIGGFINSGHKLTMNDSTTQQNNNQYYNSRRDLLESTKLSRLPERKNFKLPKIPVIKMTAFVCDECARPLHLYGENFIESYINGKANVLRCLCDLHADEMEVNAR